jgi:DNA-binding transcriptional MerR regulator
MHLRDAIAATGVNERTLQRWANDGKVYREDRGYGKVFYRIPEELRKDRRDESKIVALLREEKEESLKKVGAIAAILEKTSQSLGARLDALEEDLETANRRADRRGWMGGFLLATAVALAVGLVAVVSTLESERATSRQIADSLEDAKKALQASREDSIQWRGKAERATRATTATAFFNRLAVSMGIADQGESDKSATRSGVH